MAHTKRFGLSTVALTVALWSSALANNTLFSNDAIASQGLVSSLTLDSVAPGQNVNISVSGNPQATTAGQFNLTTSISNITEAFCVDLQNFIFLNSPYINKYELYTARGRVGALLNLKASFFASASGATDLNDRAAAFQIALWEIAYDHAAGNSDDLNAGIFQYNQNATIVNYANGLLSATSGQSAPYFYLRGNYGDDPAQDLVTLVPEPTSLMALAVGAVGLFVRRRRT
ncbi:MAG: hypothetical protein KatS3mg016_1543 [Fimbriimonadales bacterium]|nr:MAG: hypothetical protein KatS3mg016_1535 [Fimbriimonadales bacterium]GIV05968.1 MAG: hypothetical protein KatS3mg016_1543 [Fimbriimonadales bacterium]